MNSIIENRLKELKKLQDEGKLTTWFQAELQATLEVLIRNSFVDYMHALEIIDGRAKRRKHE